jgi:hypothetical protein
MRRSLAREAASAIRTLAVGALLTVLAALTLVAQPRRPAKPVQAPAEVHCPAELGRGVKTGRTFCDVLTGRDPSEGILVKIPPHRGSAWLTFDLHARHVYSAEREQAGRAYAHYTASVVVLTLARDVVGRAVVDAEFRSLADAYDRIGGGAGPNGLKAVVPVAVEPIRLEIPEKVDVVSLLGEKLRAVRAEGETTYTMPGYAVAVVSRVMLEYRPAPVRRR